MIALVEPAALPGQEPMPFVLDDAAPDQFVFPFHDRTLRAPSVGREASNIRLTPSWVLDLVRAVAPIALDPCGHPLSLVGARRSVCLPDGDGLELDWRDGGGLVYWNPPYSRGALGAWAEKATSYGRRGIEAIGLVPGDASTAWFSALVEGCAAFALLRRRVAFLEVGAVDAGAVTPIASGAKFCSALFYQGRRVDRFRAAVGDVGHVFVLGVNGKAPTARTSQSSKSGAVKRKAPTARTSQSSKSGAVKRNKQGAL